MTQIQQAFHAEVIGRLEELGRTIAAGGLDEAIALTTESLASGGVLQAFGTGHSEAFAMEIAGRAGGFIPTNKIALRDLVLRGGRDEAILSGGELERDPQIVDDLVGLYDFHPEDVFLIASNSGVNGSIVGLALAIKERGHKLIAVTSLQHTNAVTPKHPSGKRLSEIADVVIDNLAPFGDATLSVGDGIGVGAVSSLTAAYIAQILTISAAERMVADGHTPPMYISANRPGGDEHNHALEERYGDRIRRSA
ncbi:sugar isomerase domain-containing protein [Pseudactinotalea sp. HY158]|uniref:sugar isomerase domain-containing protein n=1 Tax=Pseudactinotalea sp. HY158 TaxID=2654547 RepID=UPI001E5B24E9|nr:SIS domain-containing protein [Pseudactinotalea sp. HY158]